jgi:hypothetical protein
MFFKDFLRLHSPNHQTYLRGDISTVSWHLKQQFLLKPHFLSQLQVTGSSYPAPAPRLQLYNTVNEINFAPLSISIFYKLIYTNFEKKHIQLGIWIRLWQLQPPTTYTVVQYIVESFHVNHQGYCWSHLKIDLCCLQLPKHRALEPTKDGSLMQSQDRVSISTMLLIEALAWKHDHINHYPPPPQWFFMYIKPLCGSSSTVVELEPKGINFSGTQSL